MDGQSSEPPPPSPGRPFRRDDLVVWPRCSLHPNATGYQFDRNSGEMWCGECWCERWEPQQRLVARGRELETALRAVGLPEDASVEALTRHHRAAGIAIGGAHANMLLPALEEAIDFIANVNAWTRAQGLLESNGPQLVERLRNVCQTVWKTSG